LPGGGVTHARAVSRTASGDVTPPSTLVRAHAPVPPPLSAFVDLMRRVLAGCCHPLLVVGPSRHYPRNPCGGDRTHTPPCPPGALTHFFPGGVGLTLRERRSAHGMIPAMRLRQGAVFRGCSHSLMFDLPHSLVSVGKVPISSGLGTEKRRPTRSLTSPGRIPSRSHRIPSAVPSIPPFPARTITTPRRLHLGPYPLGHLPSPSGRLTTST
jgi:hypothetical protein